MKRNLTFLIAILLLSLVSVQPISAQCVELGTPIGTLAPVLKTVGGVCGPAAVPTNICDCPPGFVVVGYQGMEGNSWGPMVLSQFTLRCKALNPNGTLGTTVMLTCANGSAAGNQADGPFDAPLNQAIVCAQIRIGCAVDGVTGYSKPMADIIAGLPNATSNIMPMIGGGGGSPGPLQHAPNGSVIIGMQAYEDPSTNISGGVAWRYAPVVACPLTCSVDGISVSNISACNDNGTPDIGDDTFTANVTVTFSDIPATGTLNLSGDGTASIAVGSLVGGSHTFTGVTMAADGTPISLTAAFSADPACTLTNNNAGTAPNPCSISAMCVITNIVTSNISLCDNNGTPGIVSDDTFTGDVLVTYVNPPASGTLNLSGDATASVPVGSIGASSHTFTGLTMTADGFPIAFIASFSANAACIFSKSNTGQAPGQCSVAAPPGSIPTMSEWGLILFALIIFTFSVVFGTQHQQSLAMSGSSISSSRKHLPFDKVLYFKALPWVYLGFVLLFSIAIALFGYKLTNADIPGSLLSGLVIAYLVQFVMKSSKPNN